MSRSRSDGALVAVRVRPRSARDEILGWREGVLQVRVTAPPVEGQANGAVAALVAGALGLPPSAVRVVRGEKGREKLVSVAGLGPDEVRARLRGREERR